MQLKLCLSLTLIILTRIAADSTIQHQGEKISFNGNLNVHQAPLQANSGYHARNDVESDILNPYKYKRFASVNEPQKKSQPISKASPVENRHPVLETQMEPTAADLANSFKCLWKGCGKVFAKESHLRQHGNNALIFVILSS